MKARVPFLIFLALLLLAGTMLFWFAPHLPSTVVTQFEPSGGAASTMAKAGFLALFVLLTIFWTAFNVAVAFFVHKMPERYLALMPNRDYWLSAERAHETHHYLAVRLTWFGNATLAMFLAMFYVIMRANTGTLPYSPSTASSLITTLYLTFLFVGGVRFKRHFNLPK